MEKVKISVDLDWYSWLEFFHAEADFGPADGDVRDSILDAWEKETGFSKENIIEE